MAWQRAIEIKRQDLWSQIPLEWEVQALPSPAQQPDARSLVREAISLREQQISDRSACDILYALRCGELSAQEVFEAFAHRVSDSLGALSIFYLFSPGSPCPASLLTISIHCFVRLWSPTNLCVQPKCVQLAPTHPSCRLHASAKTTLWLLAPELAN